MFIVCSMNISVRLKREYYVTGGEELNITLLAGFVVAVGTVVFGIGFADLGNFWDPNSVIIVVGGTLAVMVASTPLSDLKNMPKHFIIALMKTNKFRPDDIIDEIVECSKIARTSGLLALEERANQQEDEFFKEGLLLIVDAIDATKIQERLESEISKLDSRHAASIAIYERGAAFGPAFGMIGTLIGLINMLKAMDFEASGGASDLSQAMSVALVTTFYGSLLANVLFTPIASQLTKLNENEILCKEIIIEGLLAIQAGENPKFIREKLLSFLSEKDKMRLSEEAE